MMYLELNKVNLRKGLLTVVNVLIVVFCSMVDAQVVLTKSGGGVKWQSVSLGSDNQNITGCGLNGNNLTIGILNGSSQTVNLSGVKDGTGSDNQNITGCGLSGNNLTIGISNGSSQTVTLPTFSGDGSGIYGGSGSITNYRGVDLNGQSLSVLLNNSGSFVAQNIAVVNGKVPIARSSTSYALELGVDNAGKPSTSTWNISSDARLKNIIGEYSKGLDEIIQLNTIRYYYKDTEDYKFNDDTKKTMSYGFIAQEVDKVFPECVKKMDNGYLSLDVHAINVAYVNAIKELHAEITQREQENKALELELAELRAMAIGFESH